MTTALNAATPAQLAAAVEANLYAFFRAMQTLPNGEIVEDERLSYHHAFPYGPMFKGIWCARLTPEEVDSAVEQALDWFKQRRAPLVAWWISSVSEPSDLAQRIQAHGFMTDYADDPGMAADLHTLNETPIPDGLTIRQAEDEAALEDWRAVLSAAFNFPDAVMQAWVDLTLAFGIANAPWRHHVGYWQGKPVATNFSFVGGGVVGLYCVATVPDARNRGFGAAITLQPLLDARAAGCHYAVLFASKLGAPLYQRVGFHDTGNRISRYVWRNNR